MTTQMNTLSRLVELRWISPLSVAKVFAGLYGGLALCISTIYGLGIGGFSVFAAVANETPEALFGLALAAGVVVVLPVLYGLMGGLFGALMAFLYNLSARFAGGLQIELAEA